MSDIVFNALATWTGPARHQSLTCRIRR